MARYRISAVIVVVTSLLSFAYILQWRVSVDSGPLTQHWWTPWRQPWQRFAINTDFYYGRLDCDSRSHTSEQTIASSVTKESASANCLHLDGISIRSFEVGQARTCESNLNPSLGLDAATALDTNQCVDRSDRLGSYDDSAINGTRWSELDLAEYQKRCVVSRETEQKSRTAVVLRAWDGFHWTRDDIHNARAMFAELSLSTGGQYELFVLLHIQNTKSVTSATGTDPEGYNAAHFVPPELVNLTEIWTYADVQEAYPAVGEYDVYYHTFMPLQLFAQRHPEFDAVWNWEMDVRYTGHYGQLFSTAEAWAREQLTAGLLERNTQFYIPSFHGTYANFTTSSAASAHHAEASSEHIPTADPSATGPDLITLFPLFNVSGTHWPHRDYILNYPPSTINAAPKTTRYGTVGTNMRLSRTLLTLMHEHNLGGAAMMSEMWPPTLAAHNGLKTVYVPHAIFLDRSWPSADLAHTFNGGLDGHVGGAGGGVIDHEGNLKGSTWWWNAEFASTLYAAWMGLASAGPGSPKWEREHGQMCLPAMLLHPVKTERLFPGET